MYKISFLHHSFLAKILYCYGFIFLICGSEIFGKSKENIKNGINFSGIVFNPNPEQKPDAVVVLLHGYGDTAENFIMISVLLSNFLPKTLFVAINGTSVCKTIPGGRQWLSASQNNKPQLLKEIKALELPLQKYLNKLLKKYDIPAEKLAFFGFSQGARVALHMGLNLPKCAGIVAFSGSYLDDPKATDLANLPVLIVHGDADQKAPVALAKESYAKLDALKIPVTLAILPGVPHEVDPQGIAIAGQFLQACLAKQ